MPGGSQPRGRMRASTCRSTLAPRDMTLSSPATDTVVLVHGLWVTPLSWEHWIERYTSKWYKVVAKAWPGMDVPIEELRRDPSALAHLGVTEIVDHFDAIVREQQRAP